MKKLVFITTLLCMISALQAQESTEKVYKNEFGIDGTNFVKQFLNFNSSSSPTSATPYSPVYYLTYRRKFEKGNIRFGAGGNFTNNNDASQYVPDSLDFRFHNHTVNLRLGWEFAENLSKRWEVFYGLDMRCNFIKNLDEYQENSSSYYTGYESITNGYNLSPLLGIRFRISKRLSVSTEASYSVQYELNKSRYFYTPMNNQIEPKPDLKKPEIKRITGFFTQPFFFYLSFDI
jgi:hypothetical protein